MARLKDGSLHFGTLTRKTAQQHAIAENGDEAGELVLANREIAWIARILWISQ